MEERVDFPNGFVVKDECQAYPLKPDCEVCRQPTSLPSHEWSGKFDYIDSDTCVDFKSKYQVGDDFEILEDDILQQPKGCGIKR